MAPAPPLAPGSISLRLYPHDLPPAEVAAELGRHGTRVVVVGVCMGADRIRPSMAVNKEIELRFVLGYTPLELRDTLHLLAEGEVDASPLVTGTVGLDGVAGAFVALAGAERHAKVLVDPSSDAVL